MILNSVELGKRVESDDSSWLRSDGLHPEAQNQILVFCIYVNRPLKGTHRTPGMFYSQIVLVTVTIVEKPIPGHEVSTVIIAHSYSNSGAISNEVKDDSPKSTF